jgi:hypothetical protein
MQKRKDNLLYSISFQFQFSVRKKELNLKNNKIVEFGLKSRSNRTFKTVTATENFKLKITRQPLIYKKN